ncbi:MAG: DUF1028 domain-containing protein [Pirellulales bacterium]
MSQRRWIPVYALAWAIALAHCVHGDPPPTAPQAAPQPGKIATFSIVAIDPATGVCGAAVASKYPAVGRVVPFVKAGVGAFCTQHNHNPAFGNRALELLTADKSPQEVLETLLRDDDGAGGRQLAVIDRHGRTAQHNPIAARAGSNWWGALSGRFYACQGNTLVGPQVLTEMAAAYEHTDGTLADRLLAALVAGDCAGGDHRGRLAAGIIVAKPEVEGHWLELQVDNSDDAVIELAQKYVELEHEAKGAWPTGNPPWKHPCEGRVKPKAPDDNSAKE